MFYICNACLIDKIKQKLLAELYCFIEFIIWVEVGRFDPTTYVFGTDCK